MMSLQSDKPNGHADDSDEVSPNVLQNLLYHVRQNP